MCDTVVAVSGATKDGAVWFGKNSDREPGEAQIVDHLPATTSNHSKVKCTYVEVPGSENINEVLLSRPFWMWGAEMGTNEFGVTIGNEAVFTRVPVEKIGLTGMDLVRLALERTSSATEALELITGLLKTHGQGGLCGYRHKNFRYHNSFIVADPDDAWVLETAGPWWVAERVKGLRTISNALSIGSEFDRIGDGTFEFARSQGWCSNTRDFDFARCFGNRFYTTMSGGVERHACTTALLSKNKGVIERSTIITALRDHAGSDPSEGWRMKMPCAHASWWQTRQAGQTTGSMISRLHRQAPEHWLTGTSSPCLSVFKPVVLGAETLDSGPAPGAGFDNASLFWRHERLHRAALRDYPTALACFDDDRARMEKSFESALNNTASFQQSWIEHREAIPAWVERVEKAVGRSNRKSLFQKYWSDQTTLDRALFADRKDRDLRPAAKPGIND